MVTSANRRKAAMDACAKIGACVAAMNQAEENLGSGGARGKEQVGSDDDFQPTTPKKPRLSLCPDSGGDRFIEGEGDDLDLDSTQRVRHVTAELCAEFKAQLATAMRVEL